MKLHLTASLAMCKVAKDASLQITNVVHLKDTNRVNCSLHTRANTKILEEERSFTG